MNKIIHVTKKSFHTVILDDLASLAYFSSFGVECQDNDKPPSAEWVKYCLRKRLFGEGK
jgi:hypothetical protein